jgi:hypothetical protein
MPFSKPCSIAPLTTIVDHRHEWRLPFRGLPGAKRDAKRTALKLTFYGRELEFTAIRSRPH